MNWEVIIPLLFGWNAAGAIIFVLAHCIETKGVISMTDGWEFVNPIYIYKYNHVNWFGAIVVALFYNLLCPVGSLIYWVYKLCTVGR